VPLYIAFLAWDEFVASNSGDDAGAALKMPGETNTESDQEQLTGIALRILDNLIKEAVASVEADELSTLKTQIGDFASEL
jgi:NEDD8-activating enzyme E1 regulatory subunit